MGAVESPDAILAAHNSGLLSGGLTNHVTSEWPPLEIAYRANHFLS